MRIALIAIIVLGGVALIAGNRSSPGEVSTTDAATTVAAADTPQPPATTVVTNQAPGVLLDTHAPLVDIDGWLQTDIDALEDLRGKVVVVEFWTFGCYNCKNRIPYTQDLYADYRDQGLEIVGIHSPEFAYEREVDNISAAAAELGVTWPIALDTQRHTFRQWQGSPAYWPRTYVLDQEGRVRFDHIGEGGYEELEATVAYLLANGS